MRQRIFLRLVPVLPLLVPIVALAQGDEAAPSGVEAYSPLVPATLDDAGKAAVSGMNAFSIDLYRRTVPQKENHFVSPASVSVAMSLAYRAAGGETAEEIRRVMRFSAPSSEYLCASAGVLASLNFKQPGRELATANSIWIDKSVTLRPDYLADTSGLVGAEVQQADFRAAPDAARKTINRWVEVKTHDRIKDLLEPPYVTPATRSVLVNTIYWKGNWASPFDKGSTKPEPFTGLDGSRRDLPLMHQSGHYQVLERRGVKAILLPYKGGELDMAVFLPNSGRGLPAFEAAMTDKSMTDWFDQLTKAAPRNTVLTLPRMHVEWGKDLVPTLKSMGMTLAFGERADFSAIATPEDKGVLAIGAVIHKTFLDVDEDGSEAAAATAVTMVIVTSAQRGPPPPPPFVFRADHPFFFVLRDRRTGLIVFMGRYVGGGAAAN